MSKNNNGITWRTEKRKVSQLNPCAWNPRQASEKETQDLTKSIEKFSLADPLIINTDNTLIGGHFRLKILKDKGINEIDVRVPDRKLTDEEVKELNIRLNKNTGSFDIDLLANFDESQLKDWGFDSSELDKIFDIEPEPKDDDVPEVKKTNIKRGDLFQLGRHRILCGDALNEKDINKLMNGEKANLCFTDPPYGVSYGDKNKFLNAIGRGNRIQENIKNDTMPEKEIMVFWKKAFELIRDNLTPINSYYIFGPQIQGMMMMMMMMMEAGLPYRHVIIWVKNNHVLGRCDYNYKHEPLFFGWTTKHKFYGAGKFKTSVWEVDKPHSSKLHPTMKPVEIIENAILNSSQRQEIVLDPFGGSGSTLIACEKTNRQCRMMEIDELYCQVILDRWSKFTNQKPKQIN